LNVQQRVFVVPGLFGASADATGEAHAAEDHMLTAKFELYWKIAVEDPRVAGIKPYHFGDEPRAASGSPNAKFANQFSNGAARYPLLMASIREKGRALKRKVGPR
jgi:hypothetical protein